MKILALGVWGVLIVIGLVMVVIGTSETTVNRYFMPPQILFGVVILYFCAFILAVSVVKNIFPSFFQAALKEKTIRKIGKTENIAQRNGFLLITSLMVALSMTIGISPRFSAKVNNFPIGLLLNVFFAVIASMGLYGWLASIFLSKQSGEKS